MDGRHKASHDRKGHGVILGHILFRHDRPWGGHPRLNMGKGKINLGLLGEMAMREACVYFMSNKRNGIIYCGVTNDIGRRAYEHREGLSGGFTKRYGLKNLVYMEFHESVSDAIQRETSIKRWPRAWKVRLIHESNPEWRDLFETIA